MKKANLLILPIIFIATLMGKSAFALNCVNTAYGNLCSSAPVDYELRKTVSKSNSSTGLTRIDNIKQGDTFVFYFKISNNTLNEVTLKLEDNLPASLERVGGVGETETVVLFAKSKKILEMEVKVKDSEFANKENFQKCVVNKGYLYKDTNLQDSSTATVCFGKGLGSKIVSGTLYDGVLGSSTPAVLKPVVENEIFYINQYFSFDKYFNMFNNNNFNFGFLNINFNPVIDACKAYLNGLNGLFDGFFFKQWVLFTLWVIRGF